MKHERQIHHDLHDLVHLIGQAESWINGLDRLLTLYENHPTADVVKFIRKYKGFANAWHDRIDKKLQEVMYREMKAEKQDERNNG
jgi:hypothetical protein